MEGADRLMPDVSMIFIEEVKILILILIVIVI